MSVRMAGRRVLLWRAICLGDPQIKGCGQATGFLDVGV